MALLNSIYFWKFYCVNLVDSGTNISIYNDISMEGKCETVVKFFTGVGCELLSIFWGFFGLEDITLQYSYSSVKHLLGTGICYGTRETVKNGH